MNNQRTPAKERAKQFSKQLKRDNPDYNYLKELFRHIRKELDIKVNKLEPKKLPYVPTEEEIKKYYQVVCESGNIKYVVIVKTLLYTGVRVSELINIKISDVDLDQRQIKINQSKKNQHRVVLFPFYFNEILTLHINSASKEKAVYLFESNWKRPYSDRGIRKILQKYSDEAGLEHAISPHKLRHFLFTWMKKKGVDDALIQPYSGHESRKSLEIYSKLSLNECQQEYERQIKLFPI